MLTDGPAGLKIKLLHEFVKFTSQIAATLAAVMCFNQQQKIYRPDCVFILVEDEKNKVIIE